MMKVQCRECNKMFKKEKLLYEPLLNLYKCPKCKVFTPLIKIE